MCPLQIHIQTLYAEPDSPLVSNLGERWTTGTNTVGPKKQTIQKQACPTSSSHTHQYSGANHTTDRQPTQARPETHCTQEPGSRCDQNALPEGNRGTTLVWSVCPRTLE